MKETDLQKKHKLLKMIAMLALKGHAEKEDFKKYLDRYNRDFCEQETEVDIVSRKRVRFIVGILYFDLTFSQIFKGKEISTYLRRLKNE